MLTDREMSFKQGYFRLGISSWTFPWAVGFGSDERPELKLDAPGLLKIAAAEGIHVVQIADNLPLEKLSSREMSLLKGYAQDFNIDIEVGTKGIDVQHLLRMIDIAKFLNSKILRMLPALFGKKAAMDEVEDSIRKVLPLCEAADIILVLENTEAFLAKEYAELAERAGSRYFALCVDLANAIGRLEGPHYVMDKLAPWCGNFHFKDVRVSRGSTLMGFSVEGAVSGTGSIPFEYAISKLKEHNLYPSVIIEQWPPAKDTIEESIENERKMASESIENMKSVLESINQK